MKNTFANYPEMEKYLRKHLNLPEKFKFAVIHKAYVAPAGNGHPAIAGLHQGCIPEYHGKTANVAISPTEKPEEKGGEWVMTYDFAMPWIFVNPDTWEEISEDGFVTAVKGLLESK